jgi:hypothetical protein
LTVKATNRPGSTVNVFSEPTMALPGTGKKPKVVGSRDIWWRRGPNAAIEGFFIVRVD